LFEFTLNWIEKAMLQNYGMPSEIIGKLPDTGLFNKQQIEDAYIYFNAVTRDKRNKISNQFKKLFKFWNVPIESEFIIAPQVYDKEAQAQVAQVETSAIDTIIRSLSRRDVAKVYSYVNDFKSGRATIEQTKAFLKPFLQTDENVNLFIQDPEGDG
jgi:ATP-dependent protease Clp ATPase subunit